MMFSIKYTMERLATTKTGPNDVSHIIWAIERVATAKSGPNDARWPATTKKGLNDA